MSGGLAAVWGLTVIAGFFALILGLISPQTVFPWDDQKGRWDVVKYIGGGTIVIFFGLPFLSILIPTRETSEYYENNKGEIISRVDSLISVGKPNAALDTSQKYIDFRKAGTTLDSLHNVARADTLYENVLQIPASKIKNNIKMYEQISDLDPGRELFDKKLKYYRDRKAQKVQQANDSTARELDPDEYILTVEGQVIEDDRVQVNVRTNIPGVIELMTGISLSDQAPDDVFIGKTERITVRGGSGQKTFDVSDLPQGEYEAEASFYPEWGFQNERSEATGITDPIESKQPLSLDGSGESAESVAERNEGQRWVMENVTMGMTWNPTQWKQRFGDWEEFPATSRNPDIITNYYFKSIDMTIVVNTLKDEIVTWRTGRDGL